MLVLSEFVVNWWFYLVCVQSRSRVSIPNRKQGARHVGVPRAWVEVGFLPVARMIVAILWLRSGAWASRLGSLTLDSGFDAAASTSSTGLRNGQQTEFTIQKEDFPALSSLGGSSGPSDKGPTTPSASEIKRHASFTISASDNAVASSAPSRAIGARTGTANPAGALTSNGVSLSGGLSGGAFSHLRPEEAPTSGVQAMDASNQFGLLGMLHTIIRPGNEAKKNLAMGCDLTSLGLNLNSTEYVWYLPESPDGSVSDFAH